MKKLLIVLMVLAMTSVASADLVILINGAPYVDQEVKGSDIITVLWDEPTAADGLMFTGGFNINVDHGDYEADSLDVYKAPAFGGFQVATVADGFDVSSPANTMWTPGAPDLPGAVFWYEFHVPYDLEPSSYIIIDTTGTYGGVDYSQSDITLHVFPEPMTIALLGLGGLFLARRRK